MADTRTTGHCSVLQMNFLTLCINEDTFVLSHFNSAKQGRRRERERENVHFLEEEGEDRALISISSRAASFYV